LPEREISRGDADLEHLRGVARNLEETLDWIKKRLVNMEDDDGTRNN